MTQQELNTLFDKFLAEKNGKPVVLLPSSIADNNHGQCFDLATEWTNRLGIPHFPNNPSPFPFKNAEQIYTNFGSFQAQYFDRIKNDATFVPVKGDIVLWPAALNGGPGHVAIATGEGNTSWFKSFDQNWNPKDWYPRIIQHDYGFGVKEILGVLRFKVTNSSSTTMDPKQTDKLVQFDRICIALKKYGITQSDDSNLFIGDDKLVKQVENLLKDRVIDRPKASITDVVRSKLGLSNTASADEILAKVSGVDEQAIREDQKVKDRAKIQEAVKNVTL